eukprot:GHVU01164967.1.p3 GENE.GHVU01164967.1~~GHVU01164967.1.p3  ORF type:complete len:112 (-),score=37.07 GHVU01164967.1:252-587(-)
MIWPQGPEKHPGERAEEMKASKPEIFKEEEEEEEILADAAADLARAEEDSDLAATTTDRGTKEETMSVKEDEAAEAAQVKFRDNITKSAAGTTRPCQNTGELSPWHIHNVN